MKPRVARALEILMGAAPGAAVGAFVGNEASRPEELEWREDGQVWRRKRTAEERRAALKARALGGLVGAAAGGAATGGFSYARRGQINSQLEEILAPRKEGIEALLNKMSNPRSRAPNHPVTNHPARKAWEAATEKVRREELAALEGFKQPFRQFNDEALFGGRRTGNPGEAWDTAREALRGDRSEEMYLARRVQAEYWANPPYVKKASQQMSTYSQTLRGIYGY